MIEVAHITESIPASAGGTSAAFIGLMDALATQRETLRVRAITQALAPDDESRAWIDAGAGKTGVEWVWTPPRGGVLAGAMARSAIAALRARRADVVHLHGLWCPDLLSIASAARRMGSRVVYQPHGMLVNDAMARSKAKKAVFLALGLARELRSASACVFTSEIEQATSQTARLGARTRREIVPLPVRIDVEEGDIAALAREGRARFSLPDEAPVIVFVGRLHPVKRVDMTVRALARARARVPGARLLLVGAGEAEYEAMLRALAAELGVSEAVTFAGWLKGRDKFRALATSDVLAFNSEFENFGFAAVEALMSHTPTVMTSNLSLAQGATQAGGGLTCEPTPESLGDALARVMTDPARRAMGVRGRRWVIDTFSHPVIGRRLAEIYAELVRG